MISKTTTIIILISLFMGTVIGLLYSFLNSPEAIIWSIYSNNKYEPNTYDCENYTRNAITKLRDAGYETYFVYGRDTERNIAHAWVKICQDYDVTRGGEKPSSIYNDITIIDSPFEKYNTVIPMTALGWKVALEQ